jgi:hypothetical protein
LSSTGLAITSDEYGHFSLEERMDLLQQEFHRSRSIREF